MAMDPAPNEWAVTTDFTKLIVTLAGALLGVTVTLAAQLIGKSDFLTQIALYATWGLSAVTIAAGVASQGFVVGRLRGKYQDWVPILSANISYWSLFLAAVAFAVFGAFAMTRRPALTATTAVDIASANLPALSGEKTSTWKLQSLAFDPATNAYEVSMIEDGSTKTFTVSVNSNGDIVRVRVPNATPSPATTSVPTSASDPT